MTWTCHQYQTKLETQTHTHTHMDATRTHSPGISPHLPPARGCLDGVRNSGIFGTLNSAEASSSPSSWPKSCRHCFASTSFLETRLVIAAATAALSALPSPPMSLPPSKGRGRVGVEKSVDDGPSSVPASESFADPFASPPPVFLSLAGTATFTAALDAVNGHVLPDVDAAPNVGVDAPVPLALAPLNPIEP